MKSIFSVVSVLFFSIAFSQGNVDYRGDNIKYAVIKQNNDIKGKNYIYDEWNRGMLVLNDSIFSTQDYLKYDAHKNRVLIKRTNEIIEITDRTLTGFSIIEKESNLKHDFVKLKSKNFSSAEEDGFYEIVYNRQNTNYFIKKNAKIVFDPNRSKGSQTENNFPLEFQDKTSYYIKNSKGLYTKVRLNKKDIKKSLNKHSKLVDSFVKAKKIKFNKQSDVIKLVNYYYSLD